jgi:hypothetical protein
VASLLPLDCVYDVYCVYYVKPLVTFYDVRGRKGEASLPGLNENANSIGSLRQKCIKSEVDRNTLSKIVLKNVNSMGSITTPPEMY